MPRRKPWNVCQVQGCRRSTRSGESERDVSKRWCRFHDPLFAHKRERNRKRALFLSSTCRMTMPSRKKLVLPDIELYEDGWIPWANPARCLFGGRICFDHEWKWKRVRCKVVGLSSRKPVFPPVPVTWCILCAGAYVVEPDVPLCHECC